MNMMKVVAVPMHPEGRKFVAVFAVMTAALWLVWEPLFWLGLGLTTWCYYFFCTEHCVWHVVLRMY